MGSGVCPQAPAATGASSQGDSRWYATARTIRLPIRLPPFFALPRGRSPLMGYRALRAVPDTVDWRAGPISIRMLIRALPAARSVPPCQQRRRMP